MRSGAFKTRIVKTLRSLASRVGGESPEGFVDIVKALPVVAAREKAKKALLKELMAAGKDSIALERRIRKVADALERLPLDETRKTIART